MRTRLVVSAAVLAVAALALFVPMALSAPQGPVFASLNGQNEIPDADPDGLGSFSAIVDGDQFCYGLTATNIDTPTAAHVHKGNSGRNGGIVIGLTPPATGDPGASSACVTADTALLQDILNNPSQYYVNVHNATFPGGAIRGQLGR